MEKIKYIQAKILKKFKCDGAKCNSHCCKDWIISVDDKTYQKYVQLNLESYFEFNDELKAYVFKLKDGNCPMLDDDGLCQIQKQHGEDFLSNTCKYYPRITRNFRDLFCERSLTLTCPVAADLILRQKNSMEFEEIHSQFQGEVEKIGNGLTDLQINNIVEIQMTWIKILQLRKMTIDQRLLTLGFFIQEVGDIAYGGNDHAEGTRDNVKMLQKLCTSKKFFKEHLPKFCKAVKFDARQYIVTMLKVLEGMYGIDSNVNRKAFKKYVYSHDKVFGIDNNDSKTTTISISKMVEKYLEMNSIRDRLLKNFSHVIENYLVNESFMEIYPYRLGINPIKVYYFFIVAYKIQEFLLLIHFQAMQMESGKLTDKQIEDESVLIFQLFSNGFNHSNQYVNQLAGLDVMNEEDIFVMMKSMLRV